MHNNFYSNSHNQDWVELGGGVRRRVMVYTTESMLVQVSFEKDSVGALHRHPHVQTSFVQSGVFHFTIGDTEHIMNQGDACLIPSDVLHGCQCLEAGMLIDSFTPYRADFLSNL